jgi:uncharacterized protein (DUF2147 family)
MKKSFTILFSILLVTCLALPSKALDGDQLVGIWKPSNGKSMVKIEKIGSKYYGRVVWLVEHNDDAGNPRTDINNPDASLRDTPLKGYRLLKDFIFDTEENLWSEGTIYDPNNGSTYNCEIEMKDENTIEVRGYIGAAVFGRTDAWTRMKKK